MITKVFQNNRFSADFCYRVAETLDDLKKLSTGSEALGSETYIIEERKTYISNGRGIWTPKGEEGDAIVCDCVEESTIWETLPE